LPAAPASEPAPSGTGRLPADGDVAYGTDIGHDAGPPQSALARKRKSQRQGPDVLMADIDGMA
jgi:hypothetical protein